MSENPEEAVPHERVRFFSSGLSLAGYLYRPRGWQPGDAPRPGIVMLQGYASLRHIYCIEEPQRLAAHGYWVLAFDHRGFSRSDGARGRVLPLEQAQDTHDAITYLQSVPGVDPERIALHGSSFGGANAIWVAAFDPRVRAVVSVVGVHDGPRWMATQHGEEAWQALHDRVQEAARRRVQTGVRDTWIPFRDIVLADEHARRVGEEHRTSDDPFFVEAFEAESVEQLARYRPEWVADRIAPRAAMIVYSEFDGVVDPSEALACYEALGEPKRLLKLEGAYHHDAYYFVNPEVGDTAMRAVLEFLDEYL